MYRHLFLQLVILLIFSSLDGFAQELKQEWINEASTEICSCIEDFPMSMLSTSFTETVQECFMEYFSSEESILNSLIDETTPESEINEIAKSFGLKVGIQIRNSCPVVIKMNDTVGQSLLDRVIEGNEILQTEGCQAANEVYSEVILNPQTPDSTKATAYLNRGYCKNELGDYYGAIGDLSNTLSLAPNTALAYQIMGSSKRNLGNYDNALEDLDKAISLENDNAAFYNEKGLVYYYNNQPELAISNYEKALELDSTNATFNFNLGLAFNYLENYSDALTQFIQVYELEPNLIDLSYYTSLSYQGLQQYDDAIAVLLEDSLTFTDSYNLHEVGLNYYYMENYADAIRYFTEAIEVDPSRYAPYLYRAYAYQDSTLYTESLPDFKKAMVLESSIPEIPFYYGYSYYELENFEKAIELFSKAITLSDGYAEAYDYRARSNFELENYQDAIDDFNSSLELFPNDAQIYQDRAEAYLMMENVTKACSDLSLAKELGNDVDELIQEHCFDD